MKAIPRGLDVSAQSPSCSDDPRVTAHQAFIRALPCAASGTPPPSEAAHFGMPAGLGPALAARCLVPLCGPVTLWDDCCHSRNYFLGTARFWSGLGIDPRALALRLWRVSGNVKASEQEIRRTRQTITGSPEQLSDAGGAGSRRRAERAGRHSYARALVSQPRSPAVRQAKGRGELDLSLEAGA